MRTLGFGRYLHLRGHWNAGASLRASGRLASLCLLVPSNAAYAARASHCAPSSRAKYSRPWPRKSRAPAGFAASAECHAGNPRHRAIRHRATPRRLCAAAKRRRLGDAGLRAWLWDRGQPRAWPRSWLDPRQRSSQPWSAAILRADRAGIDRKISVFGS